MRWRCSRRTANAFTSGKRTSLMPMIRMSSRKTSWKSTSPSPSSAAKWLERGRTLKSDKKTREQTELIRQENEHRNKINTLIVQFQSALDVKDWTRATELLHQLIETDPNRWEFYQNLGTIQANQTHYQEAVGSFAKGVEVAEKLLPSAVDPAQAKTYIGDMMLSEGDAY